ncbi:MAG: hypothetical protein L6V93_09290 [Clostridiales bacterium]|nr:MAG: hypothetical protein L6V93_09290 [Clostridiales bacterium]
MSAFFNLYMTAVEIPVWSMVTASGLFKADKYISLLGTAVKPFWCRTFWERASVWREYSSAHRARSL